MADASKLAGCSVAEHLRALRGPAARQGLPRLLRDPEGGGRRRSSTTPGCASGSTARIRHVIVDEYQDVNPVQEAVVATLHALGASVCVVGDDDQTIYQWRGSDVENILSFEARYPGVDAGPAGGELPLERGRGRGRARVHPAGGAAAAEGDEGDHGAGLRGRATSSRCRSTRRRTRRPTSPRPARRCAEWRSGRARASAGISWSDMAILLRCVRRDGERDHRGARRGRRALRHHRHGQPVREAPRPRPRVSSSTSSPRQDRRSRAHARPGRQPTSGSAQQALDARRR